ncbi:unnamed protein product [Amoebophrya sp. A25]|nr:unnamed protein product [Amoebophrya sp. A25]|eukprot:GSA25T00023189001.1
MLGRQPAQSKAGGFAMSKAAAPATGSFANFVQTGGQRGGQQVVHRPGYGAVAAPIVTVGGAKQLIRKKPCGNPQCTPVNWETPQYYQDIERGHNYCFVCWESLLEKTENKTRKIGLALSLEDMLSIGVTSFGDVPEVKASRNSSGEASLTRFQREGTSKMLSKMN